MEVTLSIRDQRIESIKDRRVSPRIKSLGLPVSYYYYPRMTGFLTDIFPENMVERSIVSILSTAKKP